MSTEIFSIAGALRKHAGPVVLIVIELAALMAVLCNTLSLVSGYARMLSIPTGTDERDVAVVQWVGVIGDKSGRWTFEDTIHSLESVPGLVAAAYGSTPFWVEKSPVYLSADQQVPAARAFEFLGSQGLDRVLGLDLVAGHIPADSELPDMSHFQPTLTTPALLTRALAQRLFPGDTDVLGRVIHVSTEFAGVIPVRIVGLLSHLRGGLTGTPEDDYAYVVEGRLSNQELGGMYSFRSRPGAMPAVLAAVQSRLAHDSAGHVVARSGSVADLRRTALADTRSNVWTLSIVLVILSLIAVSGLIAITSFWVQRRRTQIGVRRALGASRGDIIRYFQIENALIVGVGVCIGAGLALALNVMLVRLHGVAPLPLGYLATGGGLLLLFGQVAALAPALRAAAVPPSTALRATY